MRLAPAFFLLTALAALSGCNDDCCRFDRSPIPLVRGGAGELLVPVSTGATSGLAVLDTGTPVSVSLADRTGDLPRLRRNTFSLLGPATPTAAAPVRAVLDITTVGGRLGAVSGDLQPVALIGGDVLRGFSLEFGFAAPELRVWPRQPADDGFLASVGYAVLQLPRYGGGEFEAIDADRVFDRGLVSYAPSRLVMRSCAAPASFRREDPLPERCCRGDERMSSTGVDLSLLLSTGVGPLVLSRSAWRRILPRLESPPTMETRPLHAAAFPDPIDAEWTRLPRLALVDRETDLANDPGPCAELARARRLEAVAWRQSQNAQTAACALPCDWDPRRSGIAQNSSAYLELEAIDVAVIADVHPLLQDARAEIRPEGPEIDGLVGGGVLRAARVELDYLGTDARAIFSCEAGAAGAGCRAVARCPRLPNQGQQRACFGLPPHGLPDVCDNRVPTCGP